MNKISDDELIFLEALEENKELLSQCVYHLLQLAKQDVYAEFDSKDNLIEVAFKPKDTK